MLMWKVAAATVIAATLVWNYTCVGIENPLDDLDAQRAHQYLVKHGFQEVTVHNVDRWFPTLHGCSDSRPVVVHARVQTKTGHRHNATVCCAEAVDFRTCVVSDRHRPL